MSVCIRGDVQKYHPREIVKRDLPDFLSLFGR